MDCLVEDKMAETKQRKERKEETSWNIAKIHSYHIAELLRIGSRHQLKRNYPERLVAFHTIRELLDYGLNDKERQELDRMTSEANKLTERWREWKKKLRNFEPDIDKKLDKDRILFQTLVRNYQRKVMGHLRDLGFFPTKVDKRLLRQS